MASIDLKLRPFSVPNFVLLEMPPGKCQEGFNEMPSIPIKDVPESVLLQMCEDFKAEILRKKHKS